MSKPAIQRKIPLGRPWIRDEDREAVIRVLDGPVLTHGPAGEAFEAAFCRFAGGGHAVAVTSCTAALHLYYLHLGVGPGDDVIVPSMSHVATVHAVEVTGARPVFVDCNRAGNIDPDQIEVALTPSTRVISLVHFLGIPADIDRIMEIARCHDLRVLEDCAVGFGTLWRGTNVGLFGDAGCFSFYPSKHITSGEGGMLLTKDAEVARSIRRIRGFSYDKSLNERTLPGIYDVDRLGLNYRMSELNAALGLSQLENIHSILAVRRRNFEALNGRLSGVEGVRILDCTVPEAAQSYYLMGIVLEGRYAPHRNKHLAMLTESGIGTGVHYPHPLPRLKYYRNRYGYDPTRFPNASMIADSSLVLPVGPHVDEEAIDWIAASFLKALRSVH
jgi:dTDP-4-amino-4,6-dideoxygalactose transaminase